MLFYNVLSEDEFGFTIQHGRYTKLEAAERHARQLRNEGVHAYVMAWRSLA